MSPVEDALNSRVAETIDACTRCGKCVEACPVTTPAGVAAPAVEVISGVIDILRTGDGPAASRRWASTCMQTGDCVKACNYGVNPRFMLTMARLAMAKAAAGPREQRRQGVEAFRKIHQEVTVQSRMQVDDAVLERLGQRIAARSGEDTDRAPDFVFYTGCNLLKTPHIALTALDIMDALGVSYQVMGGPTHCCGISQFRTGDVTTAANVAETTMNKLAAGQGSGQVLTWCASCYMQFTEVMLPAQEDSKEQAGKGQTSSGQPSNGRQTGSRPFEMTPFMRYLGERIDDLKPLMRTPVPMRAALHRHPGVPGVVEAAAALLAAVPGVELVDLHQPAVGLMSNYLRTLPDYKKQLQLAELEAAAAAGVDALVAVYHGDHRELCAHERDWPFRILNVLDVVGAGMGLAHDDEYKRLKMLQDADLILSECRDRLARSGIADDAARASIKSMLDDQPLPLQGHGP
jgi:heterodisulfide reductase subunit D